MRRAALAALLLTAALPARAGKLKGFSGQFKGSDVLTRAYPVNASEDAVAQLVLRAMTAPLHWPLSLPERGFAPHPYWRGEDGDMEGPKDLSHRLEFSGHRVSGEIGSLSAGYRMMSDSHVGFEGAWTGYYEPRASDELHFVAARVLCDFVRGYRGSWGYGFGVAGLTGRDGRAGFSMSTAAEIFPRKPFVLSARGALTLLPGGALTELRAAGGVQLGRTEWTAGWRTLAGPLRELSGPDVMLALRL